VFELETRHIYQEKRGVKSAQIVRSDQQQRAFELSREGGVSSLQRNWGKGKYRDMIFSAAGKETLALNARKDRGEQVRLGSKIEHGGSSDEKRSEDRSVEKKWAPKPF